MDSDEKTKKDEERSAKTVTASELLFILAPLVILFFFRAIGGQLSGLLRWPEWSYSSVILFGQAIVKLASGISKAAVPQRWQFTTLLFSLLVLFGLVPPALMLGVIHMSPDFPLVVVILQIVWFVLSIAAFMTVGSVAQILIDRFPSDSSEARET